jgi:hypothetical protein
MLTGKFDMYELCLFCNKKCYLDSKWRDFGMPVCFEGQPIWQQRSKLTGVTLLKNGWKLRGV